jgi:hypothetical protein
MGRTFSLARSPERLLGARWHLLQTLRPFRSTGITRRPRYYGPIRHPARPSLLVTECSLGVTRSHRQGFPCCLLILLPCMPSPVPRRDWSSRVARGSTSGGLPHRSRGSAPVLRVSRFARSSPTLWPAGSLTPRGSRFLECFSSSRYLLEPLQVLPVGATSYRAGFAPARINTPWHGTRTGARNIESCGDPRQSGAPDPWTGDDAVPRYAFGAR